MADALTYAYIGDLTKFRDDEGFLHIRGVASDDSLDLDGQRCDPEWLQPEMSTWFKTGNFREMHQMNAVGKATTMTQEGTGFVVEGKIIDPLTATKVENDLLPGLSIGIKGARIDTSKDALKRAPNGIIVGGRIVEVSLVDIPANPNARLQLVKTVGGVTEKTDVLGEIEDEPVVEPDISTVEVDKVEPVTELVEETKSPLADLAKSFTDLTKSATHDPAELASLRSDFVALIKAELDELDSGEDDEISDIYQLLSSLSTFLSWWDDEADEGETAEPFNDSGDDMEFMALGVSPDTIKAAVADDATDEQKAAPLLELRKSLGLDEIATKAEFEAQQEVIKGLEAALKDVREMAAPGQPALRGTLEQQNKAAQADELETTVNKYRNTALQSTDPDTARQYAEAADELQKRVRALRPL